MRKFITLCALTVGLWAQSTSSTAQCCTFNVSMHDSYGDGWNGATLEVLINGLSVGMYSASGTGSSAALSVCNGDLLELIYSPGDYENENTYELQDATWNILFQDGANPATGSVFSTVVNCDPPPCCTFNLSMHDSYGDGWNGATLEVLINGISVGIFSASGTVSSAELSVCNGDLLELIYSSGEFENENTYELQDASWNILFQDGANPATGSVFSTAANCNTPPLPGIHPCLAIPIETIDCISVDNTGFPGSEYTPNCSWFAGGDIWYTMQVPASGNLSFETIAGSLNDTGIAVWGGNTCDILSVIGCDDDAGTNYLSFLTVYDLTPGQTIYLQAWKWGGGGGSFQICITDLGNVVLESSELPIVMIDTQGQTIISETKIDCLMDIKYNGPDNLTYVTDNPNVYSGNIGIEIRGNTSASYPQRPYNLETRNAEGLNNNVSLLGMPADNDWVLISNYNDRSLMRNLTAYQMFGAMGNYSIRTQLCEVLIDGNYKGIYMFGEKVRRGAQRVNIAKLTPEDTFGDALTGGYILQQNYWNANNSFLSNYAPIDHPEKDVHFVYEYPKPDLILPVQQDYIASFVDSLETALYSENFADPMEGYRKYLDVPSFIDYFLVNEVSRNADGFKKSVFFHKDKNSNGGKLKAGPVWDFDWSFKDQEYCFFNNTLGEGWAHKINDCNVDNNSTGWYIRLLQDSTFNNELRCTYEAYRQTMLNTDNIFAYMDSIAGLVQSAQIRHFQKWNLLGHNGPDWELEPFPDTYAQELQTLKDWISERLLWLDNNIPGICIPPGVAENNLAASVNCYPNPANNLFIIDYALPTAMPVSATLYNHLGTEVLSVSPAIQSPGRHTLQIETQSLAHGVYVLKFGMGTYTITKKVAVIH